MNVGQLGEFGLIDMIAGIVGKPSRQGMVVGIGDDASVWRADRLLQIATTDILIQGIHFNLDTVTWRELGWKALAVNISDIAAMGGDPTYALISLGLPPETEIESVAELYRGLMDIAARFGVDICGGNISGAPVVVINVSLNGEAPDGLLTRSAAVAGDRIAVTGYLGQAAAGLEMLTSGIDFDPAMTSFLRDAHLRPYPRVAEARILASCGVKTAIDLSDGLVSDMKHIGEASGVAAVIWVDRLPVHPFVSAAYGSRALEFALTGGEDYELLFTVGSGLVDDLQKSLPVPVAVIGEIVAGEPGEVFYLDKKGRRMEWTGRGWEHFRPAEDHV
ncbi:MAG: thiamine-phosphate kinase [Dehalococcoidia bacterium]|nr:thiamine-phosphate kinase [Dehalococcoidia bacterium]